MRKGWIGQLLEPSGIAPAALNLRAHVGLLSSGTAYYLFSLLAVAYGVMAFVGADRLAEILADALGDALPGQVGDDGIGPDQLRSTGTTAGIVGLTFLLYSGLGAVGGASSSMHLIFGGRPTRAASSRRRPATSWRSSRSHR